jgi:hypothetical protein
MRQAIRVALLCVVIGFALGYLGLSVHGIMAEKAQASKPSALFKNPDIYIGGRPSPFTFGGPPLGNDPPFFDPFTQSPSRAMPRPLPPPPQDAPCIGTADPCQQRRVIRI